MSQGVIGSRLGAYEILAELGAGGMGKVYRATATKAVAGLDAGTAVALKVIHTHLLETEGFFKRFLREAQIGQDVQHENVVRCYDCDATLLDGASQHFLVMEYVEGQTLRDLLKELDRVPEELCRHIGREVARGLAAIHEAGAVHRDLKPENVLITPDHVVKIMDLGVARLQAEAIRLSQTGAFVGSLEYAAPEQFRSADGEPDGRADLHSLGVVLYELATGQHPYRDEDASRVIGRILNHEPRKAGEVNPQLSPFFEEVVHTLIAKDRGERFPTASGLAGVFDEGEKSDWWKARAKALRVETKRPLRRIRIPRETALYGRDDDLARLHALYEQAKAGDGQVLLIEGEAGIGKTRLVDEFVGRLRQQGEDINFVFGSYPPGGAATAAGAFSEAYREQFGAEGLEDTLKDYLTPTPILIPAFAAILKGETTPTGAEPLTKDSLQTVFVHATRGLAAERTTIVLIDDLHFAPEDGRALFSSLAMSVPGHRILLIGTLRPGVPEEWTANVTRLEHAEQRSLSRLGLKDFSALLKDAFRSERLAHELGMKIAEKSDGNPFFAFEIIRGLREGQFISQRPDGTWVTTKVIEDIQVPSSVLDLVNARVADLSDDERNFLDVASCLGFEFDSRVVAEVLGLAKIPALQMLAKIEKRHRLVRASGRRFIFDHHQVQEALYVGLSDLLREEYHASIAATLEKRAGVAGEDPKDLDGALGADLCEHFLKGAQGRNALKYLDTALDHLEKSFLNDQAIALADRVLDVPGLLGCEGRLGVLLRKNSPLHILGHREVQEEVLKEAHVLADAAGDAANMQKVEDALGRMSLSRNRYVDARVHFERSFTLAQQSTDRSSEAAATGRLGLALHYLRRYSEAEEHYQRQLAIAREIGDQESEAKATGDLGFLNSTLGRPAKAMAYHERCLAMALKLGDRRMEAIAVSNLASVLHTLERISEARTYYQRSLAMVEEMGDRRSEALIRGNLGRFLKNLGRQVEAKEHLERALLLSRVIDFPGEEAFALFTLASVLQETGDAEGAVRLAEDAVTVSKRFGFKGYAVRSLIQLGEARWQTGDTDQAHLALQEAIELTTDPQAETGTVYPLALLACLPGGDIAAAEAALQDAGDSDDTPQVRYHLWHATGKHEHLAEAKRLLDSQVEHAPKEYRESMLKNVRLNREIMDAWEEHGEEAQV